MARRPVSDDEVNEFLDGELPLHRRAEVEARLAADPELAARVMTDMHVMDTLRGVSTGRVVHSPATLAAARKAERALKRHRLFGGMRRVAVAASLVGIGWLANSAADRLTGATPDLDGDFVMNAREALRVAQLDTGVEQVRGPGSSKILQAEALAGVDVPELPDSWTVTDVKVQPFAGKQSVVVTADTRLVGRVTLVAAPIEGEAAVPPTPASDHQVPTVYWQSGTTAYALMGAAAPHRLKWEADDIEVASRKRATMRIRG